MNRRNFLQACVALASLAQIPAAVVAQASEITRVVDYPEMLVSIYLSKMSETDLTPGRCVVARGDLHMLHLSVSPCSYFAWYAYDGGIDRTADLILTVSEGVVGEFIFDSGRVIFVSDTETTEGWLHKRT